MTYRGHVADGSPGAPYDDVGARDITAHVDTTALGEALVAAGLDRIGETSQAEFLVGCGLEDLLELARGRAASAAEALELRERSHAPPRPTPSRRVPGRGRGPRDRDHADAAGAGLPDAWPRLTRVPARARASAALVPPTSAPC